MSGKPLVSMILRILKFGLCLLLLLSLKGLALRLQRKEEAKRPLFEADTIRCAIVNDRSEAMRRNIGFNYELLGAFGEANGSYMRILPPQPGPDCWRQLSSDSLSIVVFNAADTLPEMWRDAVVFSMPVKNDIVWAVSSKNTKLLNAVNFWYARFQGEAFYREMTRRYFRTYSTRYLERMLGKGLVQGLSPYDDLVRRHAARIGMDWRLLSAVIFHESQYKLDALSNRAAKGLMQVRDVTADHYGIPTEDLFDPDTNIRLGTMLFDDLLRDFRKEGLDSVDVIKFALASYNSGGGALERRRSETARMGLDPNRWEDVAVAYSKYNNVTPAYIEAVLETYQLYQQLIQ